MKLKGVVVNIVDNLVRIKIENQDVYRWARISEVELDI
jgi:hypothetical protein